MREGVSGVHEVLELGGARPFEAKELTRLYRSDSAADRAIVLSAIRIPEQLVPPADTRLNLRVPRRRERFD